MKKNHKLLILSSLIILLPMLFGIITYQQLPEYISTHWNANGVNDGFSSKPVFVFGFPLLLLAIHLICVFVTQKDNANRKQSNKIITFTYFIIPILSLIINAYIYAISFGYTFDISTVVFIILAIMFIGLGNYLPKTTQNRTIGVKTSWALQSKDNWYHTHRFTGTLWVIGGVLVLITMFLPVSIRYVVLTILVLVIAFAPIIYSYIYYRKQVKDGTFVNDASPQMSKTSTIIGLSVTAIILIIVAIILFTGSIKYTLSDEMITMDSTYYHDVTITYDEIDEIEYLEDSESGYRKFGWGSYKLLLGTFENENDEEYMRYTYTNVDHVIRIVRTDGEVIIFNAESNEATQQLYHDILDNINK